MRRLIVLGSIALCVFIGLGFSWQEYRWSGSTMGTSYTIHAFKPGFLYSKRPIKFAALQQLVKQRLAGINSSMSTYLPDSEIVQLNQQAVNAQECIQVSKPFYTVLQIAFELHQQLPLFDVTVGPLIDLWGFGAKSNKTIEAMLDLAPPDSQRIQQLLDQVGMNGIQLMPPNCVLKQVAVELDVSSIAKGFAIDDIAQIFRHHGLEHFLIEIGGEVYAAGQKQGLRPWLADQPWQVGIDSPDPLSAPLKTKSPLTLSTSPILQIELSDLAVATSGNYRHYFAHNGVSYSHIINPKTGWPIQAKAQEPKLVSVSVVHASTARADGLATALFTLGFEGAKAFAQEHDLRVFLLARVPSGQRGALKSWASAPLQPLLLSLDKG